jgi:hypothetical protein
MVGASAITAVAIRVVAAATGGSTMRDNFAVAVATLWRPAPSAVQTQAPKTKVSPRLKATVGLK